MKYRTTASLAAGAALLLAACGDSTTNKASNVTASASALPQGGAPVTLDPAEFTVDITNEYWPMKPGQRWTYTEREADGTKATAVVIVTDQTKTLANGITARVVRDTVTQDGEILEDTFDFYAQDITGNLWYLGEDTAEFDNGEITSRDGSFEAGVDGALPGIAVPAQPVAGMAYRQEYLQGEAEDNGEVLSTDEMAEVPTGKYREVLLTKDTTALEPDSLEYKLYAKGVGPVLVLRASGGTTRTELIRIDTAPPGAGTGPLGTP
jgi:ABC-type glycerol-3-phosphate transport system substrate-binding protein